MFHAIISLERSSLILDSFKAQMAEYFSGYVSSNPFIITAYYLSLNVTFYVKKTKPIYRLLYFSAKQNTIIIATVWSKT
jgi:CRISPR/Cas system CMR-associated protein Cmr5 small subunit